jgi:hypothetical protein
VLVPLHPCGSSTIYLNLPVRLRLGPPSLWARQMVPAVSERKLLQGLPVWGGRPSPSAAPNRAT